MHPVGGHLRRQKPNGKQSIRCLVVWWWAIKKLLSMERLWAYRENFNTWDLRIFLEVLKDLRVPYGFWYSEQMEAIKWTDEEPMCMHLWLWGKFPALLLGASGTMVSFPACLLSHDTKRFMRGKKWVDERTPLQRRTGRGKASKQAAGIVEVASLQLKGYQRLLPRNNKQSNQEK